MKLYKEFSVESPLILSLLASQNIESQSLQIEDFNKICTFAFETQNVEERNNTFAEIAQILELCSENSQGSINIYLDFFFKQTNTQQVISLLMDSLDNPILICHIFRILTSQLRLERDSAQKFYTEEYLSENGLKINQVLVHIIYGIAEGGIPTSELPISFVQQYPYTAISIYNFLQELFNFQLEAEFMQDLWTFYIAGLKSTNIDVINATFNSLSKVFFISNRMHLIIFENDFHLEAWKHIRQMDECLPFACTFLQKFYTQASNLWIPDDMWTIFLQIFQTNENYSYHALKLMKVLLNTLDEHDLIEGNIVEDNLNQEIKITNTRSKIHSFFFKIMDQIYELSEESTFEMKVLVLEILLSEFECCKRGRTDVIIQYFEEKFGSFDPLLSLIETEDDHILYTFLIDSFLWIIMKDSEEYAEWKQRIIRLLRASPGLREIIFQYTKSAPSEQINEASTSIYEIAYKEEEDGDD